MDSPVTQKRRSLWEISEDFAALDDLLEGTGGELDEHLEKWFAELGADLEAKIDGYASYIGMLMARADVRVKEADRLYELAMVDAGAADRLRQRLLEFLKGRGIERMETKRYRVSVARNGGHAPMNVDPEKLPEELFRVVREPDNAAIREKLKEGPVPGVTELERGFHLRIK